ncbi:uncharacterized protein EHS24_007433 [Apiotrichum porosum]|uniref:ubiquitinyl hydrolase 1 n=1 Tax=Apiotrichum porosum TaxID=105984 RepID=A0A427XUE6_9TREE|nr:uncharacterized protein EHS24_007433 [Apiotrichum porosum]RSH82459.1 hypothetical protein EHS24_007433 [Apiotrichum porosum]
MAREPSSSGPAAAIPPPPPLPHTQAPPPDNGFDHQPQYPSLSYNPAAGPSQPQPQHFPPQPPGWQYNPYYQNGGYPPPHGGPQQRHQPNSGGFQPGFRYDQAYPAYQYPPQFYQGYGQVPVSGPGPATMQNGYYMPPNYPRQYSGYPDGSDGMPTGPDENGGFNPGMPFQQPFYPPGHPYAYGGGVGYQQPMPYNGGGYRPDGAYIPEPQHQHQQQQPPPPPPSSGKALNPAAAGFSYPARKAESLANGSVNGRGTSSPAPSSDAAIPTSGLGLSLEPEPAPAVETPIVENLAEVVPEPPVKQEEPEAVKVEATSAPTVESAPASVAASEIPDVPLTFTGAALAGVASPSTAQPKAKTSDPLYLRSSRPSLEVDGNSYAASLAAAIPEAVSTMAMAGVTRKRSAAGHAQPRGKAVYAVGIAGGRVAPPVSLTFGTISEVLEVTPVVAPVPIPIPTPVATVPASASAPPRPASPSPAPAPAPAPAPVAAAPPKAKVAPSSWAALVRGKKPAGTPDSLSVAASSTLPSPSRSTASLPSDAGPSRASDEATTPRSTAPSLPATNGPTPAQPRPAFNYAAAAAVGAPPTPAEDLAHLLTEGLRVRPAHGPAAVVPRGLINTGNMCFANTILQVLVYCTPFTELFEELGRRLKADFARRTPLLEAMIVFLREFAPGPSNSGVATPKGKNREPTEAFVPENVYDAMKENKRFDSMRRGYQEDAEEYLGFFLNTLHEELLGLYSRVQPARAVAKAATTNGDSERTINRPVSPGAGGEGEDDDWLEVGKKQKTHVVRTAESKESSVSRVFGGTLRSVLHTPGAKDSVTLEPYQPLQLDVQDAKVSSVVDALRHLNEPETVGGVWSASRNANVDATKQVYIDSFPPVLILHLKRFVYDPQEQNVVKRDKPVAYSTELAIPQEIISATKRTAKPVMYRLFGVVYHHGHSATGGHYTVAVSRPNGTGWLHFDDEIAQPVPADDVIVSEEEVQRGRAEAIGGREKLH